MLRSLCFLMLGLQLGLCMHCKSDEVLDNVSSISKVISPAPKNLTYWKNYHIMYYTYGEFGSDPSNADVVAGLYTTGSNGGDPLFIAKLYCSNKSWKVYARTDGILHLWRSGLFKQDCVQGTWDLVLKVEQRKRAFFMFNNEDLDNQLIKKYLHDKGDQLDITIVKKLPVIVTDGDLYKVTVGGNNVIKRFAYGKCWTFPHELMANCSAAYNYVQARTKTVEGLKLGIQSANSLPTCYEKEKRYWYWQQLNVHIDENSDGNQYCCCTNMTTGEQQEDREVITITDKSLGLGVNTKYYKYEYKLCAMKRNKETTCDHFMCMDLVDNDILEKYINDETAPN